MSLCVYCCLEDFCWSFVTLGNGKIFIAWLCGMWSLKAEPCAYVCVVIFVHVLPLVCVQAFADTHIPTVTWGVGKVAFPLALDITVSLPLLETRRLFYFSICYFKAWSKPA